MIGHAFKLGVVPVLIAVGAIFITATLTLYLSRLFKLDDRQGATLAGALSTGDPHVCAIMMPMTKAKGGQVVNSAICVILFGALASMIFPFISHLFNMPEKYAGFAAALGIGNGHQALSAAYGVGYEAGRYAHYFNIGRHVFMPAGFLYVFFVMLMRKLKNPQDPNVHATGSIQKVPPYVLAFIVCWGLACLHVFKEPAHHQIFNMVIWDFSLAAGALGLSVPFKEITRHGLKGFAVTCLAGMIRLILLFTVLGLCIKTGLLA